ncbi:hypothetical protein ONZ45_g6448 [Pleurotus djamor]|nr:hypothetical protein ONZ45_g6448 [Pleurotus djamor]
MFDILATRLIAFAFFATVLASPLHVERTYGGITPRQLLKIAPDMASCNASAPFPEECRTAYQSAPFVNQGFEDYGIKTKGEKAAILSLMLFETGNFRFDIPLLVKGFWLGTIEA